MERRTLARTLAFCMDSLLSRDSSRFLLSRQFGFQLTPTGTIDEISARYCQTRDPRARSHIQFLESRFSLRETTFDAKASRRINFKLKFAARSMFLFSSISMLFLLHSFPHFTILLYYVLHYTLHFICYYMLLCVYI